VNIIKKKRDAMRKVNQPPWLNLLRFETRNAPSIEKNNSPMPIALTVDFLDMPK
jgi:hypothetical protein